MRTKRSTSALSRKVKNKSFSINMSMITT
jgi:hypothetical protein